MKFTITDYSSKPYNKVSSKGEVSRPHRRPLDPPLQVYGSVNLLPCIASGSVNCLPQLLTLHMQSFTTCMVAVAVFSVSIASQGIFWPGKRYCHDSWPDKLFCKSFTSANLPTQY